MKTLLMISALTLMNAHLAEAKLPGGSQMLCTGPNGIYLDLFVGEQIGNPDIIGGTKQSAVLSLHAPKVKVENEAVVVENYGFSTRCGLENTTTVKFSGGVFGITTVSNNACGQDHYSTHFLNVSDEQYQLDCQVGAQ